MSNLIVVIPYTPEVQSWLDEFGVPPPNRAGRFPTLRELLAVLAAIPQLDVWMESFTDMQITVTDRRDPCSEPWVSIIMHAPGALDGPEADRPQEFFFAAGWSELREEITRDLAAVCGPLVLVSGSDGVPHVFLSDASGDPIDGTATLVP